MSYTVVKKITPMTQTFDDIALERSTWSLLDKSRCCPRSEWQLDADKKSAVTSVIPKRNI